MKLFFNKSERYGSPQWNSLIFRALSANFNFRQFTNDKDIFLNKFEIYVVFLHIKHHNELHFPIIPGETTIFYKIIQIKY